jgi:hypothetical protein
LVGKSERKSPVGRSRLIGEDNIKMDPRDIGWGSIDCIDLAQGRGLWRTVVGSVMNIQAS